MEGGSRCAARQVSFIFVGGRIIKSILMLSAVVTLLCLPFAAMADEIVFQVGNKQSSFIPFGEDGTPGRPWKSVLSL
jgi:hypothetical protein